MQPAQARALDSRAGGGGSCRGVDDGSARTLAITNEASVVYFRIDSALGNWTATWMSQHRAVFRKRLLEHQVAADDASLNGIRLTPTFRFRFSGFQPDDAARSPPSPLIST